MLTIHNIFGYLRDLYQTNEPLLRFYQEPQNTKQLDAQYFTLHQIQQLADLAKRGKYSELSLQWDGLPELPFLSISRISIPELKAPESLREWVAMPRVLAEKPKILVKMPQKQHRLMSFDRKTARLDAFATLESECSTLPSPTPPILPAVLDGWVTFMKNEQGNVAPYRVAYKDEIELFEESEERSIEYTKFNEEYVRYYQTYWTAICINRLYDAMHSLNYDLRGKENKRVYLSFGLVNGKIGGASFLNYLFHVPLKLSLKNQVLSLELDTFGNKIFSDVQFAELLSNHFNNENAAIVESRKMQVLEAQDEFNRKTSEFYWDGEFLRSNYYESAQKMLSVFSDLHVDFCENNLIDTVFYGEKEMPNLTLTFSPIIQTKIVESELLVAKDAGNILRKIDELEKSGDLSEIPQFFQKLSPDSSENLPKEAAEISTRHLFPLPYNDEQRAIAERLLHQNAVTVKGPPGTGKSHTIANLVSNFVANGQSVLIVSQNAQALAVVKDKLPSELRELAISLVNDSRTDALKASVSSIISHLSRVYSIEDVALREEQLAAAESKYEFLLQDAYAAIGANSRTMRTQLAVNEAVQTVTAHECAMFLLENESNLPFKLLDAVVNGTDTKEYAPQIMETIRATDYFDAVDLGLANYVFVQDDVFLNKETIKEKIDGVKKMGQGFDFSAYSKIEPSLLDNDFIALIGVAEANLELVQADETGFALFKSIRFNLSVSKSIIEQFKANRTKDIKFSNELLQYDVNLGNLAGLDVSAALRHSEELLAIFGDDEELGFFTKFKVQHEHKRLLACLVNGETCDKKSKLLIANGLLLFGESLKKQQIVLNNYFAELVVGQITKPTTVMATIGEYRNAQIGIEQHWQSLELALTAATAFNNLNTELAARRLQRVSPSMLQFEHQWNYVLQLKHYANYRSEIHFLSIEKQRLLNLPKSHPIMLNIAESLTDFEAEQYAACLKTYRDIRAKAQHIIGYNELLNRVRKWLPKTAESLHQGVLKQEKAIRNLSIEDIETAIIFAKIKQFVEECLEETGRSADILQQLNNLKHDTERYTGELVAYKTWYNKSKKITDNEKSALTAWLNDLTNIGRGYGKNTSRNRASAVQNMQLAKGAVPIWIMQLSSALTFFPEPTPGQFDVLIIDEASQCDMSSLNFIFRAKKSIIVGDENQTAVTVDYAKFGLEKVNALLDRYFLTHPFKQQFNIQNKNNSIYSLSSVIYPNIITLVEHFRCLPQIIGYSNTYVYSNRIVPLKTATSLPFGAPVAIEYIAEDELGEEEARPKIVQRVLEHILLYILQFEARVIEKLPTIGVLTLDSSNMKHNKLLLSVLLSDPNIAKYADALDLTIGTSREFQGDERNVMFLTMSATHSVNANGEIRPPRAVASEEYMRIYNVAASRAKDRCVVLHSIDPEAVGLMSADCYRKRLIDYYTVTQRAVEEVRNTSLQALQRDTDNRLGVLGKDVCAFLVELGVGDSLYPNYTIGHYATDFALLQQHQKVAIFCDIGSSDSALQRPIEQSIQHQLILERAGWQVIRIQSTQWFADKVNAKARLKASILG